MLTTIAALSKVPLKDVRKIALNYARRKSWLTVCKNENDLYWRTVRFLIKACGLLEQKIPTNDIDYSRGNRRRKLPKGKEGSIITVGIGWQKLSHIEPFSNGMIWGTQNDKPLSLEEYKEKLKAMDARVKGIWY